MIFLVDAQLPRGLAARLASAGHQAVHVFDVLAPDASDMEIALEANHRNAIVISKDEDFVALSIRGVLVGPLLWVRCGNMTTSRLWRIIEPLLPTAEKSFAAGERIVEIR